ncbi:MAG: CPBP family intramembrane metalloprotease [Lachnospiraceae bacterium]|nr:CPBP family intramembrane metalloprotease [Lachnospiraceae bacterium]
MKKYNQTYRKAENYVTYPRTFEGYRWFKPIIELILAGILYVVAVIVIVCAMYAISPYSGLKFDISSFTGSYDTLDAYSVTGAVVSLGGLAVMIPILWLVLKITKSRPFSSLSSSRGDGWSGKVFKKCLLVAIIVNAMPNVISALVDGYRGDIRFTVAGFIACAILVPFQCMAEEYFFRGFLMQTFGSWFRIPWLAIILQTVIFAIAHPYNIYGVIAILIDGLGMGLAAYIGKGLEASSAIHIANNFSAFMLAGFGLNRITADVGPSSIIMALCINVIYVLALAVLGGLFGWFEPVQTQESEPENA